jgi:hypothetical protein
MVTGRMHRPRRLAALWLGALVLALSVLAPATGASGTKKVKTSTGDMFVDADSVNGTISSKRAACESGRKVKLRVASNGDKVLGTAKTDKQGRWVITIQLGVGTYYAEVEKASKGTKQGKVTCQGAKSKPAVL